MTSQSKLVESRGKAVQPHFGRTQANRLGSLPTGISAWINGTEDVTDTYGRLETQAERKAFFDEFLKVQRAGFDSAWVSIYQTVDLIRKSDWYWQAAGFESFDVFWQTQGEALFGKWAELESTYQYAHIAAPSLFKVDYDEAHAIAQRLTAYRELPPSQHKAVASKGIENASKDNSRDHEDYCSPVDARIYLHELASAEFNAGYNSAPRNGNGEDRRSRFKRIMRDAPDVADRFLAGEFIRRFKNGRPPEEDLVAAEVAAGIRKEGEKVQRRNGLAYCKKLADKLKSDQLKDLHSHISDLLEFRK